MRCRIVSDEDGRQARPDTGPSVQFRHILCDLLANSLCKCFAVNQPRCHVILQRCWCNGSSSKVWTIAGALERCQSHVRFPVCPVSLRFALHDSRVVSAQLDTSADGPVRFGYLIATPLPAPRANIPAGAAQESTALGKNLPLGPPQPSGLSVHRG